MLDFSTDYLGLKLENPLIAGSSGLSENIDGVKEIAKYNPGAIVLKSLFEEEILKEMKNNQLKMTHPQHIYPEIFDYFDDIKIEDSVSKYLFLIEDAKKIAKMPIIASINCVSSAEWTSFAKRIQDAGADAIELNAFILPSDMTRNGAENEKVYFDIVEEVRKVVTIPVSMKISWYFSNLAGFIQKLSKTGLGSIVMFNRFYSPDIDLDRLIIKPASIYSGEDDLYKSLSWIAIMAQRTDCQLSASTGVHSPEAFIKQLLAGADTVQVASVLYQKGIHYISELLNGLNKWMIEHEYSTIDEFRGKLSQAKSLNPAAYERVQFMKHFGGIH
jgi:dihydroorotate dehydrogenase (fumarate)